MYRNFSVKCGRCGTMLQTEIAWSGKISDIGKEGRLQKIKCPRCHFTTTYDPKSFS
jgi:ribosomal protein S27E